MKRKVEIGAIFGCYKVLEIRESQKSVARKSRTAVCQCLTCGAINTITVGKLREKKSNYCQNCRQQRKPESLIGQKFGMLTVIGEEPHHVQPNGSTKVLWKCQCECGNVLNVRAHQLRSGHTKSCGCYAEIAKLESLKKKFIGTRFNKLVVVDYDHYENETRYWKCQCDCGNTCVVSSRHLQSKKTIGSCGCEGSKAENALFNILEKRGIPYQKQFRFDDCKDIKSLPFDFAIFNDNNNLIFLVELNGEQHYYPFTYCGESKEQKILNYEDRKRKDCIKERYCIKNDIPLLIIKYNDFDKLEQIFMDYYHRNKNNKLKKMIERSENDFRKIRISSRKLIHTNGIYQIDLTTRRIIKKWDMVKDIVRECGYSDGAIVDCCAKRGKTAYGYGWAYVEDSFDLDETIDFCLDKKEGRVRPTVQIDIKTNEVVAEFKSASEAARIMGCKPNSISGCCNGQIKTCKGYVWKYKDDYIAMQKT